MIFSARLDSLGMSHAGVRALVEGGAEAAGGELVPVVVLFDHEGSAARARTARTPAPSARALEGASSARRAARARTSTARSPARSACRPT